jgi:hypothetical protein
MTLQIADLSFDTSASTTGDVLRIVEISFDVSGNAPTILTGTVSPPGSVLPGTQVTMTVTIQGSYTSVTWTVLPGSPTVELAGSQLQKSFTAPYVTDTQDVMIGITAVGPGGTSQQLVLTSTVVAQALGWYVDVDSTWQPVTGTSIL